MAKVTRWTDLPEIERFPGVFTRRFRGEKMLAILVRLTPDALVSPQFHPEEQLVYLLSGRLRLTAGATEHVLGPGEAMLIPANEPHSARVAGEEPAVYLEVLVPPLPVIPGEEASVPRSPSNGEEGGT
ncbi:MAG: cupin domain-containing protein [Armatimonadetes bacterium]|nr:cupin domain-containing protein [Armatimonadota bacterium]